LLSGGWAPHTEMSLFASIQADAAEAQEFVAQMNGKTATGTNALINKHAVTMVFGSPVIDEVPSERGGIRRRVTVPASITRTQLSAVPESRSTITRTDMTPHITYRIVSLDTHDPIRYNFMLEKYGE
jgi:hypothetical protein